MTSKTEADDYPKNWFYPIFNVAVHFFEGTPESGQGVKMSEIVSFFDFRMSDPLDFGRVIVEKPKFHVKKSSFRQ